MADVITGILTPSGSKPGDGNPDSPGIVKYVTRTAQAAFGTNYPPTTKEIINTEIDWSGTSFRATCIYVIPSSNSSGISPGIIFRNGVSSSLTVQKWYVQISSGDEHALYNLKGYSDRVESIASITDTWHTNNGYAGPSYQTIDMSALIIAY